MIIMSATFGALAEQVQGLCDARSIISEGRCFPVKVYHHPVLKLENWEPKGLSSSKQLLLYLSSRTRGQRALETIT